MPAFHEKKGQMRRSFDFAIHFAKLDLALKYRRSLLGPHWHLIQYLFVSILLTAITSLFSSQSFGFQAVHIFSGMFLWNFFQSMTMESATVFHDNSDILLNTTVDETALIFRVVARNIMLIGYQLPFLFLVVLLNFHDDLNTNIFLFLPTSIFLIWFFVNISLLVALAGSRFSDIGQFLLHGLQLVFYSSPIIWSKFMIPQEFHWIMLELNPLYWILEVFRAPLFMNAVPTNVFILGALFNIFISAILAETFRTQSRQIKNRVQN
jgi:ABC-type polysaccharide/polyol phosphate export permease